MSLSIWSDILDICNDQSTFSTKKSIRLNGIPLKYLLQRKKGALENMEAIDDWPNKFEEQVAIHR